VVSSELSETSEMAMTGDKSETLAADAAIQSNNESAVAGEEDKSPWLGEYFIYLFKFL
jgi:hypothetical protein